MVWLLTSCSASLLNWRVICYTVNVHLLFQSNIDVEDPFNLHAVAQTVGPDRHGSPRIAILKVHPWHNGSWKFKRLHDFLDGVTYLSGTNNLPTLKCTYRVWVLLKHSSSFVGWPFGNLFLYTAACRTIFAYPHLSVIQFLFSVHPNKKILS